MTTTYTIGRFDAGGYYVVMEDGVGICRTKSLGVARRIVIALAAAALARGPLDDANHVQADTLNIVELQPAVEEWP